MMAESYSHNARGLLPGVGVADDGWHAEWHFNQESVSMVL